MHVFRPADAIETAECWALAIKRSNGPSTLALTRQGLPPIRHDVSVNHCEKGAYRVKAAEAEKRAVIIATGSEVSLAMDVAALLEAAGHGADVVSMPCTELFDEQSEEYKSDLLGSAGLLRISIEAGTTFGWERYTGLDGLRFGIDSFGASAPINDLFAHFGLTAEAIAPQIIEKIG
jgi:transketolase